MSNLPSKIFLSVVTPERHVVREEVDFVHLPGSEGYLGVLPGHTPFLTSLKIGEISYRAAGVTSYLAVSWGFVEVLPDKVTVLADHAERPEEIDAEAARKAKEQAQEAIRTPGPDFQTHIDALEQALTRLQVASKAQTSPAPKH